jgi:hypothetical protein
VTEGRHDHVHVRRWGNQDGPSLLFLHSLGPALYHVARSRQSETWAVLADHGVPTPLLLAASPAEARVVNEEGEGRFAAAVSQADVRWVPGATHSLVTDERERFGATVATWLGDLG